MDCHLMGIQQRIGFGRVGDEDAIVSCVEDGKNVLRECWRTIDRDVALNRIGGHGDRKSFRRKVRGRLSTYIGAGQENAYVYIVRG